MVGILGATVGSFLSVLIYRLPRKISLIDPVRSYCTSCNSKISWFHNLPIISYLTLRGKCASCHKRYPVRYLLIEIISSLSALVSFQYFGATWTALAVFALTAMLIVQTFIDLDFKLILHITNYPMMVVGVLLSISSFYLGSPGYPLATNPIDSLLGLTIGFGVLSLLAFTFFLATGKDGMGGGDTRMLGMLGAWLGWQSIATIILLSSIIGSVIGIIILLINRGDPKSREIPFGPFIAIAALLYIYFPQYRFPVLQ